MSFTDEEIARYARHLVLREVGGPGQQKLKAASVLIVGAGHAGVEAALAATSMLAWADTSCRGPRSWAIPCRRLISACPA